MDYFLLAYAVYASVAIGTLIYTAIKVIKDPKDIIWWGWPIIVLALVGFSILWPIFWLLELGTMAYYGYVK